LHPSSVELQLPTAACCQFIAYVASLKPGPYNLAPSGQECQKRGCNKLPLAQKSRRFTGVRDNKTSADNSFRQLAQKHSLPCKFLYHADTLPI
jgi:hypothetical protein